MLKILEMWLLTVFGLMTSCSAMAPFLDRRLFLTKFQEQVQPEQVNDDFWFTFSAQDQVAHDTITVYDDDYTLVYLSFACLGLLILSPFAAVIALVIYFVRRRRRQAVG